MSEEQSQPLDIQGENLNQTQTNQSSMFPKEIMTDPQMALLFTHNPDFSQNLHQYMPTQANEDNKEKHRISARMAGFDPKDNEVWRQITQRFGANVKQPELLSIANVLAMNANIKLDRDAKRRKSVLIKWFQENWAIVSPFLDFVVLEETQHQN